MSQPLDAMLCAIDTSSIRIPCSALCDSCGTINFCMMIEAMGSLWISFLLIAVCTFTRCHCHCCSGYPHMHRIFCAVRRSALRSALRLDVRHRDALYGACPRPPLDCTRSSQRRLRRCTCASQWTSRMVIGSGPSMGTLGWMSTHRMEPHHPENGDGQHRVAIIPVLQMDRCPHRLRLRCGQLSCAFIN